MSEGIHEAYSKTIFIEKCSHVVTQKWQLKNEYPKVHSVLLSLLSTRAPTQSLQSSSALLFWKDTFATKSPFSSKPVAGPAGFCSGACSAGTELLQTLIRFYQHTAAEDLAPTLFSSHPTLCSPGPLASLSLTPPHKAHTVYTQEEEICTVNTKMLFLLFSHSKDLCHGLCRALLSFFQIDFTVPWSGHLAFKVFFFFPLVSRQCYQKHLLNVTCFRQKFSSWKGG